MLSVMAVTWQNRPASVKGNRSNITLKISYITLQLVDLVLTLWAMNLGYLELNPFMKGMLASPLQLAVFKFAVPLLIVTFVPGKLLIPAIMLLAAVVGWNVKELFLPLI